MNTFQCGGCSRYVATEEGEQRYIGKAEYEKSEKLPFSFLICDECGLFDEEYEVDFQTGEII